ncbi:hypothetical protein [Corynebacterium sphenisci]|uniref:hypothetical protein n=1 Tax=Corynebacterium sphenisci TaxID=191493 RepID=UPI0026DEC0D0|nr:hypothetical protein [Corynebacterium sphenisci]MDO5730809.1 hypothetical protein [Corynebacterium sphenisci]
MTGLTFATIITAATAVYVVVTDDIDRILDRVHDLEQQLTDTEEQPPALPAWLDDTWEVAA